MGRLLDRLFGRTRPPAASDRSNGKWDGKEHSKLGGLAKSKRDRLRSLDLRSKAKYDKMDEHVASLAECREKIRAMKERKRTRRLAQVASEST